VNAPVVLGIMGSVLILAVLFELLRRRHLREKYAVTWAAVAVGVLVLTIFPGLLYAASDLVGVDVPANLLFFLASMVLMVLTLQHSYELGRLEDKTRTLAEELALLRLELDQLRPDEDGRPETEAS
jgi:hypothetical protein